MKELKIPGQRIPEDRLIMCFVDQEGFRGTQHEGQGFWKRCCTAKQQAAVTAAANKARGRALAGLAAGTLTITGGGVLGKRKWGNWETPHIEK